MYIHLYMKTSTDPQGVHLHFKPFWQLCDLQVNYPHLLKNKNKIKSRIGRLHKRSSNLPTFILQADNHLNFLKHLGSFSRKDNVSPQWTCKYTKSRSQSSCDNLLESRSEVSDHVGFVLPGTPGSRHLNMLSLCLECLLFTLYLSFKMQ